MIEKQYQFLRKLDLKWEYSKLSEKKIEQYKETIEANTSVLEELKGKIKYLKSHLKNKNSELGEILKETEKEEKTLLEKSKEFEKKIEDNLISAYKRIRSNVKNGLAIVPVEEPKSPTPLAWLIDQEDQVWINYINHWIELKKAQSNG